MKKIVFLIFVIGIFLWFSGFSGDMSLTLLNQDVKAKINSDHSEKTIQPRIDFLKMPLSFIVNKGQVDKRARFYAKASGYTLWLTAEGLVFDSVQQKHSGHKGKDPRDKISGPRAKMFEKRSQSKVKRDVSRLVFIGANKNPEIVAVDKTSHKVNYFIGNDPKKWHGDIPTCGAVLYKNIYKNIDLKVYGIEKKIEYDWIVRPGGNPADIRFEYQNVKSTNIDKKGNLVIETGFGRLMHQRPVSFLKEDKLKSKLAVKFKRISKRVYGFSVPLYDKNKTLVIDPVVLVYSTFLGGSNSDYSIAIAVDNSGCAYVTGSTPGSDFPTLNQFQTDQRDWDVFVTKLDTTQSGVSSLIFSTYLGGSFIDDGNGIAVDSSGCAYVTGRTYSSDFPILNQYQTDQVSIDVFVTKLDTTQSGVSSLIFSTYLGGSSVEYGNGIAVDSSGCAYVTGITLSTDFPTFNQFQTYQGNYDAFVTKIDTYRSGASSLIFSTYLGGSSVDYGEGIAVDNSGCAYVTGDTLSTDFPILNQYQTDQGSDDAFVTKIDTTRSGVSSLIYSTYLGGSSREHGNGIAVDSSGCAYVTGYTRSIDFPTLNPYQATNQGGYVDVFVTKLDTTQPGVSSLIYSTYLGGSNSDYGEGIALDSSGCAYVTGSTGSNDFPVLNQFQTYQGGSDVFVTKIDTYRSGVSSLIFSTYLGGGGTEYGLGIALDSSGSAYVTGCTASADFPILNQFQTYQGNYDAFVTKLSFNADIGVRKRVDNESPGVGDTINYTITVFNNGPLGATNLLIIDLLPAQLTFVSSTPSVGSYNSSTGIWNIGNLANRGSERLVLRAKINAGGIITNRVGVYSQTEDDPVTGNNTARVDVIVISYRVTASVSGGNGIVSPETQTIENSGQNAYITITPGEGFGIASITDNGVSQRIVNPYVIRNVKSDHNVVVTFKPSIILGISAVRKTERAWIIKRDYGKVVLTVANAPSVVSGYELLRSTGGGPFEVISNINKTQFVNGQYMYNDKFIDKNKTYIYKFAVYYGAGKRVLESNSVQI